MQCRQYVIKCVIRSNNDVNERNDDTLTNLTCLACRQPTAHSDCTSNTNWATKTEWSEYVLRVKQVHSPPLYHHHHHHHRLMSKQISVLLSDHALKYHLPKLWSSYWIKRSMKMCVWIRGPLYCEIVDNIYCLFIYLCVGGGHPSLKIKTE